MFCGHRDVFVAATRAIHHDNLIAGDFRRDLRDVRDGMRSFEGGNDSFGFR
jgi:hypothetical protein